MHRCLVYILTVCVAVSSVGAVEHACPTGGVVVLSNSSVTFTNCPALQHIQLGDLSSWVVEHVRIVIRASSMEAVPVIRAAFGVMDVVRGVSVTLRDVTVRSSGHANNTFDTGYHLLALKGTLLENISVTIENCSFASSGGEVASGMGLARIDGVNSTARVSLRVVDSVWSGYQPMGERFVSVLSSGGNVRHATVDIERSTLVYDMRTTESGGWVVVSARRAAEAIAIRLASCNVAVRIRCLQGDLCDEAALVFLELPTHGSTLDDALVSVANATLRVDAHYHADYDHARELKSIALSVLCVAGEFSETRRLVTRLTVFATLSHMVVRGKEHAALFRVVRCDDGVFNTSITLTNSICELSAVGNINSSVGARLTGVVYISNSAPLRDATIVLEGVRVAHRLTSGMDPKYLVGDRSRLLLVAADCVAIGSAARVRIIMERINATVVLANGSMTCLDDGTNEGAFLLCLIGATAGAAALRVTPPDAVTFDLSVDVTNVVLTASVAFTVVETYATQVSGLVSYHAALLHFSATENANLTIAVQNSTLALADASMRMSATTLGRVRDCSFVALVQMQSVDNLLVQELEQHLSPLFLQFLQDVLSTGTVSLVDATVNVSLATVTLGPTVRRDVLMSPNVALLALPTTSQNVQFVVAHCTLIVDPVDAEGTGDAIPGGGGGDARNAVVMANPAAVTCFVNCSLLDGTKVRLVGLVVPCLVRVVEGAVALLSRAVIAAEGVLVSGEAAWSSSTTVGIGKAVLLLGVVDVAGKGSQLTLAAGAELRIAHSSMHHLDQLLVGASSGGALVDAGGSLVLGCNRWDDAAFPSRTSSTILQGQALRMMFRFRDDEGAVFDDCAAPIFSVSETESIAAPEPPLPALEYSPRYAPPAAVVAVAVVANPLDGAALIAFGQSACAPAAVRASTHAARFLLSPLHWFGDAASALGNFAIVAAVVLAHYAASRVVGIASRAAKHSTTTLQPVAASAASADPWARVRFPNFSIAAGLCLAPGTAFFTVRLLASGNGVLSVVLGVLSTVLFAVVCVAWWRLEVGVLRSLLRFERYRVHVVRSMPWVPRWALPIGRWGGAASRHKYGRLRGFARRGCERLALLPYLMRIVTSALLGIPLEQVWWCPLQAALLCTVAVVAAWVCLALRPARVPLIGWLLCALYALQIGMYASSAAASQLALDGRGAEAAVDVATFCSVVYSVVSVAKNIHAALLFLWERARQHSVNRATVEGDAAHPMEGVLLAPIRGAAARMELRRERSRFASGGGLARKPPGAKHTSAACATGLAATHGTMQGGRCSSAQPPRRDDSVALANLRALIDLAAASAVEAL